MTQLQLFDQPASSTVRVPAVRSRTSIAAAEAIRGMAGTLRGKVYAHLVAHHASGATRHEIADALDMHLQTVCGRIGELKQMGLVWEGDEARNGRKVLRPTDTTR